MVLIIYQNNWVYKKVAFSKNRKKKKIKNEWKKAHRYINYVIEQASSRLKITAIKE